MDRSKAARAMGSAKSQAKTDAARLNARKGGWRKGAHRHAVARTEDVGFRGPVAFPGNPAAHGNICVVATCRCGAVRHTNVNQSHIERGVWIAPEPDDTSDYE